MINGSASVGGKGEVGRDPPWKYCILVERNINITTCNYYGLVIKSGNITRFKFHLSHINPQFKYKKVY